jgi:hypothetical protein
LGSKPEAAEWPQWRELVSAEVCQTGTMIGRRTAALLCVLLGHAVILYVLFSANLEPAARTQTAEFAGELITLFLEPAAEPGELPPGPPAPLTTVPLEVPVAPAPAATGAPALITTPDTPGRVDWPVEGQKSVKRMLAREAEAERIARMFAGPGGTWASLTKRQRSKLDQFKWKPGVDGLEYDEKGNAIYRLPNGCAIVNSMFFACQIGKQKANGNMFDNMREYFDEQRLPQTDEGNGTEPEALRPPN